MRARLLQWTPFLYLSNYERARSELQWPVDLEEWRYLCRHDEYGSFGAWFHGRRLLKERSWRTGAKGVKIVVSILTLAPKTLKL